MVFNRMSSFVGKGWTHFSQGLPVEEAEVKYWNHHAGDARVLEPVYTKVHFVEGTSWN